MELIEVGVILTRSSIKDYDLDQVWAEFEQVIDRNKALCTTTTKIITSIRSALTYLQYNCDLFCPFLFQEQYWQSFNSDKPLKMISH